MRRKPLPKIAAQLATLVRRPPEGAEWMFEIKYDGYRAIAYVDHGRFDLVSRNDLSFSDRFRSIVGALAELPVARAILDGEVCATDEGGRTHFEGLQNVMRERSEAELIYFVFDVLWLDGQELRGKSLRERKKILERLIPNTDRGILRRATHVIGRGADFLEAAREIGLEGLVAKRIDRPHVDGRTLDWQKVKVDRREELVIVGYTPPRGSRHRLGALLLATRDRRGGPLRFAGKVGTGLDTDTLELLYRRMQPLRVERPPVEGAPRMRGAVWIEPELVGEIRYAEWTRDHKLRQPCFIGLRDDKRARDVIREVAS